MNRKSSLPRLRQTFSFVCFKWGKPSALSISRLCFYNCASAWPCRTDPLRPEEVVEASSLHSKAPSSDHKYPCRYCGRVLMSLVGRQQHERLHTGQGFTCDFCGKSFTTNSARQRHISGVHERKRFPCDQCIRTFCQLGHLNVHRSKCHSGSSAEQMDSSAPTEAESSPSWNRLNTLKSLLFPNHKF